ncbi:MAG: SDR family NAD(P)-dependent oxidoreductase [Patescibacteria group bacterium]
MPQSKNSTVWNGKKVLVTGGTGFIGSHVVEQLVSLKAKVRVLDRMRDGVIKNIEYLKDTVQFISGDCADESEALKACEGQQVVMNLAAKVGGIAYNSTHQATMLFDNLKIASVMIEAARCTNVERFLVVSSACIYPADAKIPTAESEGFLREPEPTNGGYGWAKRMAEKLGMYYSQQYGMKVGIVRPYNAYGPRDHFDPEKSHVIPALIKRVFDGENPLRVWGSGNQTRAFLYVEDFAKGLIDAIDKYPVADPVNIGTNEEVSINTLVEIIVSISGKNTKIEFDTSKPDGSPRRNSDNTKAIEKIGFRAQTKLVDGLKKTIDWYKKEQNIS